MDAALLLAGEGTVEELWASSEHEVRATVRKFVLRHMRSRRDFEECFSEALIYFMRAVNDWPKRKEGCGNWPLHLRRHIWYGLFDTFRRETQARCKTKVTIVNHEFPETLAMQEGFDVESILENVCEDAAIALKLVLDMPDDIKTTANNRGGNPRNFRSCIRAYLIELGWGTERVNDAFSEIRQALS